MRWLEVCVEAGDRGTEKLCAFLEDLGVSGLVVEDEADLREFMEKDTQYWDYIDEDFVDCDFQFDWEPISESN